MYFLLKKKEYTFAGGFPSSPLEYLIHLKRHHSSMKFKRLKHLFSSIRLIS